MTSLRPVTIGFMPLVDAASLFVAVDKGFAAAEGLDVFLVEPRHAGGEVHRRLALIEILGAQYRRHPAPLELSLQIVGRDGPPLDPDDCNSDDEEQQRC